MIGDPEIAVNCDNEGCGEVDYYGMTPLARGSFDDRNLMSELESDGWIVDEDANLTYCCEECKEEAEEDERDI